MVIIMNNLMNYYLMPHPPIIIPEVGKGEEVKIQRTIDACKKVGQEIKSLVPETIIIITPHGVMFRDCLTITYQDKLKGDLSRFNASMVKNEKVIDLTLTKEIIRLSNENKIPLLPINNDVLAKYHTYNELDHGSLIPLSYIKTDYQLVHITYSMLNKLDLFRFGMIIKEAVQNLKRKTVVIASGDLSHRLTHDGPYPYSPSGKVFDETLLSLLSQGDVLGIFNLDPKLVKAAGECGLRSIYVLLGAINRHFTGEVLSYEGPFGVGYGVVRFNLKENHDYWPDLTNHHDHKQNSYVSLARQSIEYYFKTKSIMAVPKDISEELTTKRAGVFVSLKKYGELRGCVGTFLPTTNSIAQEIINNAIEAAFHDPRFNPLQAIELEEVEISVDVLSKPEKASKEMLDPHKYGVIVSKGYQRGLLLPDLEGIDTVDEQLRIACLKAGITGNYEIERFTVTRYYEG
jgi:AmmeMemoRadiSam system protein A